MVWPMLDGQVEDYVATLEDALQAPLGSLPFEQLVGDGSTVALVVDDPSRWTPVSQALPILLRRIHAAGVRPSDVTISVGVGRHHAVDDSAMRRRVGDEIVERYVCHSPPVDDLAAYDDLGTTSRGRSRAGLPARRARPTCAFWWDRSCRIFKLDLAAATS